MTFVFGRLPAATRVQVTDVAGTPRTIAMRVVTFVGTASYVANGQEVDASAFFSRVVAAVFVRQYLTATGKPVTSTAGRVWMANDDGKFATGKFMAVPLRTLGHTHTYDKADTPTGLEGALTNVAESDPHSHALTYTSTNTGTQAPGIGESAAGNDLSSTTVEFLVFGVPV